jgi:hypothetical protein
MVRARPQDIDEMLPGVIFALMGLWEGRNKHIQESMKKQTEKGNATRN